MSLGKMSKLSALVEEIHADIGRYGQVDPAWSDYRFVGENERKTNSLYLNQNTYKPPKSENCAIMVLSDKTWHLIEATDGLVLKLFIEGGSDAPRIRLRLTIGNPQFPDLLMEVIFMAWSHGGTYTPRAHVALGQMEAARDSFTFSSRLSDLTWNQSPVLRPSQMEGNAALFGKSDPVIISWVYDEPICMNFDCLPVHQHALSINRFKLLRTSSCVKVLTKGSKKLVWHSRSPNRTWVLTCRAD